MTFMYIIQEFYVYNFYITMDLGATLHQHHTLNLIYI